MNTNMIIYGEYPVDQILPLIGGLDDQGRLDHKSRREFQTSKGLFKVKINSKRLRCFLKSITCSHCGISGSFFRLEMAHSDKECNNPHLNFYAVKDDEIILMTQDHVIPRSKGGKDNMSNLVTMCYLCNEAKGSSVISHKAVV